MTVSKRAFLGVAAGGAVAAPAVAKSLVQEVQSTSLGKIGGYYGVTAKTAYDVGPSVDPNWQQNELARLIERRQRTVTSSEFEEHRLGSLEHLAGHYDSLRSVAANPRRLLFAAEASNRARQRELSYIDQEIANLKKQMGPLALVLS